MSQKQDPRTLQTERLIKKTLLQLMQKKPFHKITVTEVCAKAGIHRGTFYLHYCDLFAVLEELEEEALRTEPAEYHCSLTAEHYQCPYGICDKIHTHPEYGVIFFDDSLTEHVIEKIAAQSKEKYIASLTRQCCLTPDQAETIFYFQLNGCLAINKKIFRSGSKDWEQSRDLIGGFIQSGLKRYIK
ncbi:MAG: TetR/AcrR family transcriptional regulator [Faecousia sp.]